MSYAVLGPVYGLGQYFAPSSRQPRMDLGPAQDWTPEGREQRQTFERGLKSFLDYSSAPQSPFPGGPNVIAPIQGMGQWESNPQLRSYQRAQRELQVHNPSVARELAMQAAMIGRQADLRRGRHMAMNIRRPGVHGLGHGVPAVERNQARRAAQQLSALIGTPVAAAQRGGDWTLCVYAFVPHIPSHYGGLPVHLCETQQALADTWVTPAAPPGASYQERATIGVPTRFTGARVPWELV